MHISLLIYLYKFGIMFIANLSDLVLQRTRSPRPGPGLKRGKRSKEVKSAENKLPYNAYVLARIVRCRKKNHLTQKEVAACLGIKQQTYSEYERGKTAMHIEDFLSLARLFNVSMDFICGASNLESEFPRY